MSKRKKSHSLEEWLSQERLIQRGWTVELIDALLPEAYPLDGRATWRSSLVLAAEQAHSFQHYQRHRTMKQQPQLLSDDHQLISMACDLQFLVPILEKRMLEQMAYQHYQQIGTNSSRLELEECDRSFLDRICVNFIRHGLTNYDKWTTVFRSRPEAVTILRSKLYTAIAMAYPYLKAECDAQLSLRFEQLKTAG